MLAFEIRLDECWFFFSPKMVLIFRCRLLNVFPCSVSLMMMMTTTTTVSRSYLLWCYYCYFAGTHTELFIVVLEKQMLFLFLFWRDSGKFAWCSNHTKCSPETDFQVKYSFRFIYLFEVWRLCVCVCIVRFRTTVPNTYARVCARECMRGELLWQWKHGEVVALYTNGHHQINIETE